MLNHILVHCPIIHRIRLHINKKLLTLHHSILTLFYISSKLNISDFSIFYASRLSRWIWLFCALHYLLFLLLNIFITEINLAIPFYLFISLIWLLFDFNDFHIIVRLIFKGGIWYILRNISLGRNFLLENCRCSIALFIYSFISILKMLYRIQTDKGNIGTIAWRNLKLKELI